ncbi:MAG: M28 family peptidase [Planctomycetota bacterium]
MSERWFGFGAKAAKRQEELEQRALALAGTDSVAQLCRALAAGPHIAGTQGDARTRDYVLEQMAAAGLAVSTAEYEVYLPHPTEVLLERLTPDPKRFTLSEPALAAVPGAAGPEQWPAWHAYAAAGDVRGPLVYVNYARESDLDQLAGLGVELKGGIAIARYGGEVFRGNKVLNVQRRGAVGCILYSDPHDDGYFRGEVYPAGPMRPAGGIQRGSLNTGAGDPTAPGRVSRPGVERIRPEEAATLPRIPSVPIGYGVAGELLAVLGGPPVPQEWQGGLPFRYHVGAGPVEVRIRTAHDGGFRQITNTFGRLEGAERPDEWVIVGAHRDAWCGGAADNVSGVVSVLEAARVCAALARDGFRPRRTLLFATWDAEEWGLIGSTEWVEEHSAELLEKVVAYINQDLVVSGPNFSASASPALGPLIRAVAEAVPSPDQPDRSVFDLWTTKRDQPPTIPQPGGGSDHEGFALHLGIPACGFGFGGPWGNYHSAYDCTDWVERIGDPGYRRHAAAARLTTLLALRLANAAVPHLDYVPYAEMLAGAAGRLKEQARGRRLGARFDPLERAIRQFKSAASLALSALDRADWERAQSGAAGTAVRCLMQVERMLVRPAEDPAGTWHRNLVAGVDPRSGYTGWALPGLTGAAEEGNCERLEAEIRLLARQLGAAIRHLRTIAECIG